MIIIVSYDQENKKKSAGVYLYLATYADIKTKLAMVFIFIKPRLTEARYLTLTLESAV